MQAKRDINNNDVDNIMKSKGYNIKFNSKD